MNLSILIRSVSCESPLRSSRRVDQVGAIERNKTVSVSRNLTVSVSRGN